MRWAIVLWSQTSHQISRKMLECLKEWFLVNVLKPRLPAVGEAPDDGQREEEDPVLGHLPRHRHHLRGVVALRAHRQDGRWNQTRSAPFPRHRDTRAHTRHVPLFFTFFTDVALNVFHSSANLHVSPDLPRVCKTYTCSDQILVRVWGSSLKIELCGRDWLAGAQQVSPCVDVRSKVAFFYIWNLRIEAKKCKNCVWAAGCSITSVSPVLLVLRGTDLFHVWLLMLKNICKVCKCNICLLISAFCLFYQSVCVSSVTHDTYTFSTHADGRIPGKHFQLWPFEPYLFRPQPSTQFTLPLLLTPLPFPFCSDYCITFSLLQTELVFINSDVITIY